MKKRLLALLFLLVPLQTQSTQVEQAQLPIFCAPTAAVFEHLKLEYGELAAIYGRGFTGAAGDAMTLWLNPRTLTWTILYTNGSKTCIVGVGLDFTVIDQGKKI